MKYKETNTNINISGMTPTYTLPNDYFEFEITGKNTTTNKDIWYDINIKWGDQETGKTRIRDEFLRFTLKEKIDNGEWTTPIDAKKYSDFQNGLRMWVNKIGKDQTTDTTRTYRLYVWIDGGVKIGNNEQDYTISEWNNLFASVKVDVTGDFTEKEPYQEPTTATFDTGRVVNTKLKLLTNNQEYTGQDLTNEQNIIFWEFNLVDDKPDTVDFTSVNIISAENSEEKIYAWREQAPGLPSGEYIINCYTDAENIYLNEDSSYLFKGLFYTRLNILEDVNVDTVHNMSYMFSLDDGGFSMLKDWDVSNVTNMTGMFEYCIDINYDNLKNWNVSNVTDMSYMFFSTFSRDNYHAYSMNASPINNWDVRKVTNFDHMFGVDHTDGGQTTKYTYPIFTNRPGSWNNDLVTINGQQYYSGTYVPNN